MTKGALRLLLGLTVYGFLIAVAMARGAPFSKLAVLAGLAPLVLALAYLDVRLLLVPCLLLVFGPLPGFIPTQAGVLGIDVWFTDPIVFIALLVAAERRDLSVRVPDVARYALMVVVGMVILGLVNDAAVNAIVSDARGPVYLVAAFVIGARRSTAPDRRLAFRLITVTMWYSALVIGVSTLTGSAVAGGRVEPVTVSRAYGPERFDATRFLLASSGLALFVLCVVGAYALCTPELGRRRRRQLLQVAVPSAVLVFLGFSRSSLVALGVALVFALAFTTRPLRAIAAVPALVAMLALVAVVGPRLGPAGSYVSRQIEAYEERVLSGVSEEALGIDTSAGWRRTENKWAGRSIRSSPLVGHGAGYRYRPTLPNEPFSDRETGPIYLHGFYPWALVKAGIVGLAGLLLTLLIPVVRATRRLRNSGDRDYPLAVAVGAAILGVLAVGPVVPILHELPSAVMLGLSCGFLHRLASQRAESEHGRRLDRVDSQAPAAAGLAARALANHAQAGP